MNVNRVPLIKSPHSITVLSFYIAITRWKVESETVISGYTRQQRPWMMLVITLLQNECIYY